MLRLLPQISRRGVLRYLSTSAETSTNIEGMVKKDKVVVFMKGVPDEPRCGFSNAVVQVLNMHGVQFNSYNVLEDNKIREDVKAYTSWPTIPQVFIEGQFVGGCDILIQMHKDGSLVERLNEAGITSKLLEKEIKEKGDSKKS